MSIIMEQNGINHVPLTFSLEPEKNSKPFIDLLLINHKLFFQPLYYFDI